MELNNEKAGPELLIISLKTATTTITPEMVIC
jgi:hypothetical protein